MFAYQQVDNTIKKNDNDKLHLVWYMYGSWNEDIKRKNAISLYGINGHALAQKPLSRGAWNLQF